MIISKRIRKRAVLAMLCILGILNGLCEHASSVFIFASTSSEHF